MAKVNAAEPEDAPEKRAVAFLAREVPRWSKENGCYSCHNNGDGARALLAASITGFAPPPESLSDTLVWLRKPGKWGKGEDAGFKDERLARLQFALALASAIEARRIDDRALLIQAGDAVANDLAEDGSWASEETAPTGSPATYGRPLATALARSLFVKTDAKRFAAPLERSEGWLRKMVPENTVSASAILLAFSADREANRPARDRAFKFLEKAQADDGGWGPYPRTVAEPFDTALALLALDHARNHPNSAAMIRRGRLALLSWQLADGSFPETTRPSGGVSYAQRLSTTAWATLALLATREIPLGR